MFDVYAKETCHCSLIYDDGKYPNSTQAHLLPGVQEEQSQQTALGAACAKLPDLHTDSAAVFKHSVTWFILLNLVYNKHREQVGFCLFVLATLV